MNTPVQDGRFLYNLVHSLTQRQLFFGFWGMIVSLFSGLIYSGYKKAQRRNFRAPQEGKGPVIRVDARRIPQGSKNLPDPLTHSNQVSKKP